MPPQDGGMENKMEKSKKLIMSLENKLGREIKESMPSFISSWGVSEILKGVAGYYGGWQWYREQQLIYLSEHLL